MSDNNLTPRIEQLAPELEKIISTSEPIQHLADGFGGAQGPAEGPLWWEEGGYLLFSDIHNNRRMKYQPGSGVSLFLEPTNRANGLTRDLQGRLVACEHDSRRVTRQEADGIPTYPARAGSSLDPKWSTKQWPAFGPAQMTPSCSSAAMSAADNPSQSP
jgi:sugar lactone lactonase YvrE